MQTIEIFRPGTHKPVEGNPLAFSETEVRQMATSYSPTVFEAPVVIGHPATDDPAMGWVKALRFADGVLLAEIDELAPEFADAVRAGRYKNVSASFYPPNVASNPAPGGWYLRHVGFLGATPPAVKGLRPVRFAAKDEGALSFASPAPNDAERARAMLREVESREANLRQRETADFVESLVKQARLPQGLAPLAAAIFQAAPQAVTFEFSDGGKSERLELAQSLKRLLAGLPPMVDFGERAPSGEGNFAESDFEAPQGFIVADADAKRLGSIERLAAQRGISFADAARAFERGAAP